MVWCQESCHPATHGGARRWRLWGWGGGRPGKRGAPPTLYTRAHSARLAARDGTPRGAANAPSGGTSDPQQAELATPPPAGLLNCRAKSARRRAGGAAVRLRNLGQQRRAHTRSAPAASLASPLATEGSGGALCGQPATTVLAAGRALTPPPERDRESQPSSAVLGSCRGRQPVSRTWPAPRTTGASPSLGGGHLRHAWSRREHEDVFQIDEKKRGGWAGRGASCPRELGPASPHPASCVPPLCHPVWVVPAPRPAQTPPPRPVDQVPKSAPSAPSPTEVTFEEHPPPLPRPSCACHPSLSERRQSCPWLGWPRRWALARERARPPAGARRDWAETGVGRAGRRVEPRLKRRPRAAASPLRQGTAGTAPRRHRWSTPRVARPACHGRTSPRTGVGGGGRDTSVPRPGAAPPFVTRVWAAGHCCDKRRIGAGSPVSRIADVRIVLCSGGSYGPSYGPTIPGACATRRPRCAWPSLFLVGTQRADHPQAVADPSTGTLPPRGGRKGGGGGCKEREGAAGALPVRARLAMTAQSGVATLAFLCSQPSRTLPPPSTFNLPSIHARGARTSLPPGSDAWAMMVSKGGRQRGRQAATLVGSPNRGGGHGQRPRGGPPAPAAAPAAPKAPCRRRCRRRCNGERKVFRRPPPPPPEAPAIGEPAPPPSSQSPVAWPAAVRTSAAAAVLGAALAPSTPLTYHNDE